MANKTLSENVNQAISDFGAIKQAIVDKGVDVPTGTPTSQYGAKIGEIQTGGGTTPTKGFLPTAWDADGYFAEGDFYGDNVPDYYFASRSSDYVETPLHIKLTKINFKNPVYNIGKYSFCYMSKLEHVSLPEGLKKIDMHAFDYCQNTTFSEFPSSLEYIGYYAFADCYKAAFSVIPANVTYVGNYAFQSCRGITSITFKGTPTTLASYCFSNCSNLRTMNVPWSYGEVSGIPFGASNATISYNYVEE